MNDLSIAQDNQNDSYHQHIAKILNLGLSVKLAFVDIDNTLTGDGSGTGDPQLIGRVKNLLNSQGYLMVVITSRTAEMMISEPLYHLSRRRHSFSRPPPQFVNIKTGQISHDPRQVEPAGILDSEVIIASTGSSMLLKQKDNSYRSVDHYFMNNLPSPSIWRNNVRQFLQPLLAQSDVVWLSPLESEFNYQQKITNIFPPDYRIQLYFASQEAKHRFKLAFELAKKNQVDPIILSLCFTDDSNPLTNIFTGYLTPTNGKITAVEFFAKLIQTDAKININQLQILLIGDSWPDLQMGFYANTPAAKTTFLLVGGSRLTKFLLKNAVTDFAGEDLSDIKNQLQPLGKRGCFKFTRYQQTRSVVIGDLAFPGKVGPESIVSFLESQLL